MIVKCLKGTEDDIVRFYACKTLENISAQSISAGHKFATLETANHLLGVIATAKNENFKTSACVALSHVCKLNASLFPIAFEKITCKAFCAMLSDGQPRVQQAYITMLNLALTTPYPKINEILLQEDQFLQSLLRLLEHHSIVIRGKCLLTFLLLFKQDFRWMSLVDSEIKFYHIMDRMMRDNFKYVQCCLLCLVEGIIEIIPTIFLTISEELNILINGGKTTSIPTEFDKIISRTEFKVLKGNLTHIAIILDLINTNVLKSRIINTSFLKTISNFIENCEVDSFKGSEEFVNALLLIVESMSGNSKVLISMNESILQTLLPVLISKLKSESADIRFLSLKIFTDIIIQYLKEER
jgi:hypothetical protein